MKSTEYKTKLKALHKTYNKKSPTWVMGDKPWQVHEVGYDDARNEIGIHLLDCEINSPELSDALETAERDGFTRIFLHKLPENVICFETYRNRKQERAA